MTGIAGLAVIGKARDFVMLLAHTCSVVGMAVDTCKITIIS
jgi:hypothetical protein